MLIRRPDDIPSSAITPEGIYVNRRSFIGTAGALAMGAITAPATLHAMACAAPQEKDKLTDYEDATTYNNYYEFGTD